MSGGAGGSELSATEHGFWALQRLRPDSAVSNIAFVLRFPRPVGASQLRAALLGLGLAHPVLRSRFVESRGAPRRELLAGEAWLAFETAASMPPAAELRARARQPFDLRHGGLLRCLAFPQGALFVIHHVVFDLGSVEPFVETLCALLDGARAANGTVPAGFNEPRERDLDYWTARLEGARGGAPGLPTDHPPATEPSFEAGIIRRDLPERTRAAVHAFARAQRATPNVVYCAAFASMLHRHGAGDDLFVAVPVSLRSAGDAGRVGCMFTTLPLRVKIERPDDFTAVTAAVRARWLEAVQHRQLSFADVVKLLPMDAEDVHSPLFRHMFSYHQGALGGRLSQEAGISIEGVATGLAHLDLELRVFEDDERSRAAVLYSTDLFEAWRAEAFLDTATGILDDLATAWP